MKTYKTLRYYIKTFQTNKYYIVFQLIQLILATVIIIRALTSKNHFRSKDVMIMEYILLSLMVIDMLLKGISQGFKSMFKLKRNLIDFVIIIIFAITLIFLTILENNNNRQSQQYQRILQTDDIIIIVIVMTRYIIQIARTICTIRNTHRNIVIDNNIKAIDLNIQVNNVSGIGQDSMKNQQIVKDKIMKIKIQKQKQSNDDQVFEEYKR